jgi:hypothetical protein
MSVDQRVGAVVVGKPSIAGHTRTASERQG